MAAFYSVRNLFKAARLAWTKDEIRPDDTGQLQAINTTSTMHERPYKYLLEDGEAMTALAAKRAQAIAVFGHQVERSFDIIAEQFDKIENATFKLVAGFRDRSLSDDQFDDLCIILGIPARGHFDDDPVAPAIDQAVTEIEGVCRPFIQNSLN